MKRKVKMAAGFLLLLILDQITKWWAVAHLKPKGPIPLLPDVLELYYVENRGAAFGILQNRQWIFLAIGVVVLLALIYLIPKIPDEKRFFWLRLCFYFVGAGAVGNMIDRFTRRFVVDFIYFKLIDFPVFNVADIYVTCAAAAMIFLILFYYKDEDFERIFPGKR